MTPISRPFLSFVMLLLVTFSSSALAFTSFDARYRVTSNQYSLAPSATIEHRLTYEEGALYSRMKASVPFNRWEESARFKLEETSLTANTYKKSTRVFFKRRAYELVPSDFERELPSFDRQSAIFYMAYQATIQPADTTDEILQIDARGQADKLIIDFAGITEYQDMQVAEVYFWKEKNPAELTRAYFSTEHPGLLVFAQVYGKKGEKLLTFRLQSWE